jgi:hypothetical protein
VVLNFRAAGAKSNTIEQSKGGDHDVPYPNRQQLEPGEMDAQTLMTLVAYAAMNVTPRSQMTPEYLKFVDDLRDDCLRRGEEVIQRYHQ